MLNTKKKKKLEKEVNNPTAGIMMARKSNTDFLKKIVSQLKNSSKMHGEQAVRIDKFLNSLEESIDEAPITSPSQQPYSSPEAQKMAEKDIIGMSKILGKASQMSIKKMMDGVKSGKYDAFDLQRAIMSGPVRDTRSGRLCCRSRDVNFAHPWILRRSGNASAVHWTSLPRDGLSPLEALVCTLRSRHTIQMPQETRGLRGARDAA